MRACASGPRRGVQSLALDRARSPATAHWRGNARAVADSACRPARSCRCGGRLFSMKQPEISVAIARSAAGAPASSASAYVASRGEPTRCTSQPDANSRISARVYSRPTVAWVPSTVTRFVTDCAHAGLIAGTVPTNGTAKSRAQFAERKRRGGVAGDDDQIGFVFADCSTEHVDNALDQPVLIQVSIGKVGVIRQINVARVGSRGLDFAEDRQTAKAGVKDKDRGSVRHIRSRCVRSGGRAKADPEASTRDATPC